MATVLKKEVTESMLLRLLNSLYEISTINVFHLARFSLPPPPLPTPLLWLKSRVFPEE